MDESTFPIGGCSVRGSRPSQVKPEDLTRDVVFKRVVLRHAGHSVGKTFLVILFLILRDFSMAAPTPPVPSTLYSSAVGNQQLPPAAVAAQARARAGQRRFVSWGWHTNSTARSMAPYSMHNPAAKAIVMMPDHPQPPQRQLVNTHPGNLDGPHTKDFSR